MDDAAAPTRESLIEVHAKASDVLAYFEGPISAHRNAKSALASALQRPHEEDRLAAAQTAHDAAVAAHDAHRAKHPDCDEKIDAAAQAVIDAREGLATLDGGNGDAG